MTAPWFDSAAGARGFARFREIAAGAAETRVPGAIEDFRMRSATRHLGSAALVDITISPVIYDRTASVVARAGIDHLMLTMYLAGGCAFSAGRRAITARPGDIFVVDYSEPNASRSYSDDRSTRAVNLLVPRSRLAPLLAAPNAAQASLIRRETASARLIREHMLALNDAPPGLAASEIDGKVRELTHLAAQALGPGDRDGADIAGQALLSSIKRHIEQHLVAPALGVDDLCRRFGLSRSALYRLFEPEGGLAGYIQERRLIRAYAQLTAPETRHRRILDIAIESRFASDATFARAFRRQFGVTPRDVRALADGQDLAPLRWLAELR